MRIFVRKNGGQAMKKKGRFVWSCSEDRKINVNIMVIIL